MYVHHTTTIATSSLAHRRDKGLRCHLAGGVGCADVVGVGSWLRTISILASWPVKLSIACGNLLHYIPVPS